MRKKTLIILLCLITLLTACANTEEPITQYATMTFYEAETEEELTFSSDEEAMVYVKIPSIDNFEIDITDEEIEKYKTVELQYGDEILIKVFYDSASIGTTTEQFVYQYILGEEPIVSGFDEYLIGKSLGDNVEVTIEVPEDENGTIFTYRAGGSVEITAYINYVAREEEKDELQEDIWQQIVSQCTVKAINEEYYDEYDETTAYEMTVADAIATKWGLTEDSDEFEAAKELYEKFKQTDASYSYDEETRFILYKEVITQAILDRY